MPTGTPPSGPARPPIPRERSTHPPPQQRQIAAVLEARPQALRPIRAALVALATLIAGCGEAPQVPVTFDMVTVSAPAVSFGDVPTGSPVHVTVYLRNEWDGPVTLTEVRVSAAPAGTDGTVTDGAFSVSIPGAASIPVDIAPGEPFTARISFRAGAPGPHAAELAFHFDSGPDYTLSGTGCADDPAGDEGIRYAPEPVVVALSANAVLAPAVDEDGDGVDDAVEAAAGTDPTDDDSDDDGVPDGLDGFVDSNGDGRFDGALDTDGDGRVDPLDPDRDNDGVLDGTESGVTAATAPVGTNQASANFVPDDDPETTTDPDDRDSDHDACLDGEEDVDHDGRVDEGESDPTNPGDCVADPDGDGLPTPIERDVLGTDPYDTDSDDDGVPDGEDGVVATGGGPLPFRALDADGDGIVDPLDADSDDDGLPDGLERGVVVCEEPNAPAIRGCDAAAGRFRADADQGATTTDPRDDDSDDDGFPDGVEDADGDGRKDAGETDPSSADSDGDGVQDGTETGLTAPAARDTDAAVFVADADPTSTTDPLLADTDRDGLADGREDANGDGAVAADETDPLDADSDDDGLSDGSEVLVRDTDPLAQDTDGDTLPDGLEAGVGVGVPGPDTDLERFVPDRDPATTTDPLSTDTDQDGLRDGGPAGEDEDGNGRRDALESDPADADSDDDGLSDGLEVLDLGTDPALADTDGDGLADGLELGVTAADVGPATDPAVFRPDADPSSTTDPLDPNSDGDGSATAPCLDGDEDSNHNGLFDPGETDPTAVDCPRGTGCLDLDHDGWYGVTPDCPASTPRGGDCRDDHDGVHPNHPEICANLLDDDCDGTTDEPPPLCEEGPVDPDPDRDGVPTTVEDANGNGVVDEGETDPHDADSDDDGVPDGEDGYVDTSGDGVPDTLRDGDGDGAPDALDPDRDDDGLHDGTELGVTVATAPADTDQTSANFVPDADPASGTDPDRRDSDEDGCFDGEEDADHNGRVDEGESDPVTAGDCVLDPDDDGLPTGVERSVTGTDPLDADTDDDGVLDGDDGVADTNGDGVVDTVLDSDGDGVVDPLDDDSDDDALKDGTESGVTTATAHPDTARGTGAFVPDGDPTTRTDPRNPDTDGDEVPDGNEDANRNGRRDSGELDPNDGDSDDDGLGDGAERLVYGTDPLGADSDGDGLQDGLELGLETGVADTDPAVFTPDLDSATTTDPLDPNSDGDGTGEAPCLDGDEDANGDGRVDAGETDPNVIDCPGDVCLDVDQDGFFGNTPGCPGGDDCADGDRTVNPGRIEVCEDGKDDDCDGVTDEADCVPETVDPDPDGDGVPTVFEDANGNGVVDPGETDPRDADSDDDGVPDGADGWYDSDGNGAPDAMRDTDGDGTPDPLDPDRDGDLVNDGTELGVVPGTAPPDTDRTSPNFVPDADASTRTDPDVRDTDGDGCWDGEEDRNHNGRLDGGESDPATPGDCFLDPDGDGLTTPEERLVAHTNPYDADSDDDGVVDGQDGVVDDDGDGLIDRTLDTDGDGQRDPFDPDSDGDGLLDGTETGVTLATAGPGTNTASANFRADEDPVTTTDPRDPDTDDDGLLDGTEDDNRNGRAEPWETDARALDTDQDGIQDGTELGLVLPEGDGTDRVVFRPDADPSSTTDPRDRDSDDDDLVDGGANGEDVDRNGRVDPGETDPNDADSDDDGLADGVEVLVYGTDPNRPDSDDDGLLDGLEVGVTVPTADTRMEVFVADLDPTTTTNPLSVNSDGDGDAGHPCEDGDEDANHNGRVDLGESDPERFDCPVAVCVDGDEDGWYGVTADCPATVPYGGDCDDDLAAVHPGTDEVCVNLLDDDCDGTTDEPACRAECVDVDQDGAYAPSDACPDGRDCDDGDPGIYPGAPDSDCDGVDEDCDGSTDEEVPIAGGATGCDRDVPPFWVGASAPVVSNACDGFDVVSTVTALVDLGGTTPQPVGPTVTIVADGLRVESVPNRVGYLVERRFQQADPFLPVVGQVRVRVEDASGDPSAPGGALYVSNGRHGVWLNIARHGVWLLRAPGEVIGFAAVVTQGSARTYRVELREDQDVQVSVDGAIAIHADGVLTGGQTDSVARVRIGDWSDEAGGVSVWSDLAYFTLPPEQADADHDGVSLCAGDCDDGDPNRSPWLAEDGCDPADNDCDPATPAAADVLLPVVDGCFDALPVLWDGASIPEATGACDAFDGLWEVDPPTPIVEAGALRLDTLDPPSRQIGWFAGWSSDAGGGPRLVARARVRVDAYVGPTSVRGNALSLWDGAHAVHLNLTPDRVALLGAPGTVIGEVAVDLTAAFHDVWLVADDDDGDVYAVVDGRRVLFAPSGMSGGEPTTALRAGFGDRDPTAGASALWADFAFFVLDAPERFDRDGDGWSVCAGDCDDDDPTVSPDRGEVLGDAVDQNCDGRPDGKPWERDGGCLPVFLYPDGWDGQPNVTNMGESLSAVGDLNGDGIEDLAFNHANEVYVVFGSDDGPRGIANLPAGGYDVVIGSRDPLAPVSQLGRSATMGADVDGDGYDDLVLGSYVERRLYVFFGRAEEDWLPSYDARTEANVVIDRAAGDYWSALSAAAIPDVNGDGRAEIGIKAMREQGLKARYYVFFGRDAWGPESRETYVNSDADLTYTDTNASYSGASVGDAVQVAGIGDFDGDGFNEMAFGSPGRAGNEGAVFVVFGGAGPGYWPTAPQDLPTAPHVLVVNDCCGSGSTGNVSDGAHIGRGGDLNGDGFSDLVYTARSRVYVVPGRPRAELPALPATYDPSDSPIDVRFEDPESTFPYDLAWAGDADGDGYDDLLVTAIRNAGPNGDLTNVSYLIYGRPTLPWPRAIPIRDAYDACFWHGPSSVSAGVGRGGDLNGDGLDELLFNTPLREEIRFLYGDWY